MKSLIPSSDPVAGRQIHTQETYPDPSQVVTRALELATEVAENVSPMASYLSVWLLIERTFPRRSSESRRRKRTSH
jgi:hypothetical protein